MRVVLPSDRIAGFPLQRLLDNQPRRQFDQSSLAEAVESRPSIKDISSSLVRIEAGNRAVLASSPGSLQFHFTDRLLEREELVHSFRRGKNGSKITHLLAQDPSRVRIHSLARLRGTLFETRYRSGYERKIIPCHRRYCTSRSRRTWRVRPVMSQRLLIGPL